MASSWLSYYKALLAALDGRDDDVYTAITATIDQGGRGRFLLAHPAFDRLRGEERFQAQVSRLNDVTIVEREEILAMLCGPETILTSWEPAPETCEMYQP